MLPAEKPPRFPQGRAIGQFGRYSYRIATLEIRTGTETERYECATIELIISPITIGPTCECIGLGGDGPHRLNVSWLADIKQLTACRAHGRSPLGRTEVQSGMTEMTIEELGARIAETMEQPSMPLMDDLDDAAEQLDKERAEMQRLFGAQSTLVD